MSCVMHLCARTAGSKEYGYMLRTFKLEDTDSGELMVALRYVPYF